jgi:hypothetical protein
MESQQEKISELEEEISLLKNNGKNFKFQNNYTQCYESNIFCLKLIAKIDEVNYYLSSYLINNIKKSQ